MLPIWHDDDDHGRKIDAPATLGRPESPTLRKRKFAVLATLSCKWTWLDPEKVLPLSSLRPQAQAQVESELHSKNPSSWISFRFFIWLGHKLFQLPRVPVRLLRNSSRKKRNPTLNAWTYLWKSSCPSDKFYCYSKTNSDTFFSLSVLNHSYLFVDLLFFCLYAWYCYSQGACVLDRYCRRNDGKCQIWLVLPFQDNLFNLEHLTFSSF